MTWLKKHNPEIDFTTRAVHLTRCSPRCCAGCRTEARDERRAKKEEARVINACRASPMLAFMEDADDEEKDHAPANEPEEEDLEGDHIWATGLIPEPEYICVTASVSQWLAEAFKWNSEPQDYEKHIPPHLRDFHSVFSKENFNNLPQPKPWDHAVELLPDADTSKSCKVYPLSVSEQKELDEFLKENLDSGRIHPSKSPMASPVFFVKKKCGGL